MIPGDPDALDAAAAQLDAAADRFVGCRDGVLAAAGGMESWRGPAATAARATLHGLGRRPMSVVRVLDQAGPVLREFAAALRGAQIAVARGQDLVARGTAAAASGTTSARAAGESVAAEGAAAVEMALRRVQLAEDRAAARIRALAQEARSLGPDAGTGGGGPAVGPAGAPAETDPRIVTGTAGVTGPAAGLEGTGPQSGKLGEAKLFADLVKAQAQGSVQRGDSRLSGKVEGGIGAEYTGAVSATDQGLVAKIEASAGAKAKAEGRADRGVVGAYGRAEGFAGADAGIGAAANRDGVDVGASAFAGAKGKVAGGADVGGIGAGATAEGWAGVGFEVSSTIGKGSDGKYHLGAWTGAALGVGGQVGLELSVDPTKVEKTYHEAADVVEDLGESVERGWDSSRGAISRVLDDVS